MKIHDLRPAKGAVKKEKRIARGEGSKKGGTAGRGHKGHKSRSGYSRKWGFEGGQMPLHRRLPKSGFNNAKFRVAYVPVNLGQLQQWLEKYPELKDVEAITPELLREKKLVKKKLPIKILAKGTLKEKITIKAHKFSQSAKQAIESIGGKIIEIGVGK